LSVTVVDVARAAGVSAMTVSRALNKPDSLPPATVAKVRDAAASLGYVRNRLAAGLRSSKSHLVAAVVPTLAGPVFMDAIGALTQGLADRGYHLMVGQSGYSNKDGDALLSDIISRRPDAIVLTGAVRSPIGRQLLKASGLPVLEIWDLYSDPVDMLIGFSHEAVGVAVADYFAKDQRKQLCLIGADDQRSKRRWEAFKRRAVKLGLSPPKAAFVPAPAMLGDGRKALRTLLDENGDIDAVFCSSDMLANGVLIEARARKKKVPRDLAVIGFGDLNFAKDLDPSLTSVRVDGPRLGALAAETLVRSMQGETIETKVVDVGFEIVKRQSA
jgi:LacI family gluconate utilization system Gnt-I transcriptional repressor